jgi:hypothetical protein
MNVAVLKTSVIKPYIFLFSRFLEAYLNYVYNLQHYLQFTGYRTTDNLQFVALLTVRDIRLYS